MKIKILRFVALIALSIGALWTSSAYAGVSYYVSSLDGDDTNDGKSPAHAWKSLDKANAVELKPGDRLLLESGSVFKGQLKPKGSGIMATGEIKPVQVGNYGSSNSRPRIDGEGRVNAAVLLYNVEGFSIRNLELTNTGLTRNAGRYGLLVLNDSIQVARQIKVENLYIHDVNGAYKKDNDSVGGIHFLAKQGQDKSISSTRFDDIRIEKCHIKDCSRNGIIIIGGNGMRENWAPGTRVVVRGNLIEGVGGDGIVPWSCDGALIEWNVMRDCPAYGKEGGAAAGIWPFSSDNTLLQFNEVNGHKAWNDGQAFDCDYNCLNTVYQYNYSESNEGGFMLICSPGVGTKGWMIKNTLNKGSVIRYNLSINDGLRGVVGYVNYKSPTFTITGDTTQDTKIYRNLIVVPQKTDPKMDNQLVCFDKWGGGYPINTQFEENVFVVEPGQRATFNFGKAKQVSWIDNLFIGDIELIKESSEVSNQNGIVRPVSPDKIAICGTKEELKAFKKFLKSKGNPQQKRGITIEWVVSPLNPVRKTK